MATKTKNAVDLVRDAVASLNGIEAKAAHTTRILAASCMVFYAENGGDKPARNRLAVMLDDVASEGVGKHILAWVGKNLAKYEPAIRAAIPEGAEAAREAVLGEFGDEPWSRIRSEHKPEKAENPTPPPAKAVPADGPRKRIDAPEVEGEAGGVDPSERIILLAQDLPVEVLAALVESFNLLIAKKLGEDGRPVEAEPEALAA